MWALLRGHPALRVLPLWGLVLLVNATLLVSAATHLAARRQELVSPVTLVVLGWLTVVLFLVVGPIRTRGGVFDVTLPISGRRLWLAHLVALVGSVLAVVGLYAVLVAAVTRALGKTVPPAVVAGRVAAPLGAAALLAVVLLQLPRPKLLRIPFDGFYAAWSAAVTAGLLGILVLTGGHAGTAASALLVVAVVAFGGGYRSVPAIFALAPRTARRVATNSEDRRPSEAAWRGPLALARCLHAGGKELLGYLFVPMFGVLLGGAFELWDTEPAFRDMRFLYVPLSSYLLFALFPPRMATLHHLDPLPVPRRRLLAGLTWPTAILFVASAAVGATVVSLAGPRIEQVDFCERAEGDAPCFRVPLRAYELSWNGRVPDVTSPWGESHPAERLPLVRGARPVIWNPFSAPAGSSPRFVALQISRAAEAVYGASISPEEIERRWLTVAPDGAVVGRAPHLSLRAQDPQLSPRSGPVFPVLMALVLVPWFVLLAVLFRAFRSGLPAWAPHLVFWGVVGAFVLTMIAMAVALVTGLTDPWLPRATVEIPLHALAGRPVAVAAIWLASALAVGAAYRLAEAQFRRMEIPSKPLKFSLLERAHDER